MRNIITLLVATLLVLLSLQSSAQSAIEFDNKLHDFGKILEIDGKVMHNFVFKNVGNKPLILYSVSATCGCTTPKWNRSPIAPGAVDTIKVIYNPKNRPGNFLKSITIKSNSITPSIKLKIKGSTEARVKSDEEIYPNKFGDLNIKSTFSSWGKIYNGEEDEYNMTIELKNISDSTVSILPPSTPDYITVVTTPDTLKPQDIGLIEFKLTPSLIKEDIKIYAAANEVINFQIVNIDSDSDDSAAIERATVIRDTANVAITTSYTIVEDFRGLTADDIAMGPSVKIDKTIINMGDVKSKTVAKSQLTIKNSGKKDLIIRLLKTSSHTIKVRCDNLVIAPEESTTIDVVLTAPARTGRQNKALTIITNDPKRPTTLLRVVSNIVE